MNKIIVIKKIVDDSYFNAFSLLEKYEYNRVEKLLNFSVKFKKDIDQNMLNYAYIIIFSNTNRVDQAIDKCEKMLAKKDLNDEFRKVIVGVYNQLKNGKDSSEKESESSIDIIDQEVKEFLDVIKPNDKTKSAFLSFLPFNSLEHDFFIEYYEKGVSIEKLDHQFKTLIQEYYEIAKQINDALVEDQKKIFSLVESIFKILNTNESDIPLYLYLLKSKMYKSILINEYVPFAIKNQILYAFYKLYTHKVIGNVKVHYLANETDEYTGYISELKNIFERNTQNDIKEKFNRLYKSQQLDSKFLQEAEEKFEFLYARTFPILIPTKKSKDTIICAFLYFISNNNFKSQFNVIIEKVFNLQEQDVQDELILIEMALLNN